MGWWIYFASTARAGKEDTLAFAIEQKVLYRPTHTEDGSSLIAHVSSLRPGDFIFLVYRGTEPPKAQVLGRIAAPEDPVPGMKAIDRISGDLAVEMSRLGYPLRESGYQEAIRLDKAAACDLPLQGVYGGRNALHRVSSADRSEAWRLIRRTSE